MLGKHFNCKTVCVGYIQNIPSFVFNTIDKFFTSIIETTFLAKTVNLNPGVMTRDYVLNLKYFLTYVISRDAIALPQIPSKSLAHWKRDFAEALKSDIWFSFWNLRWLGSHHGFFNLTFNVTRSFCERLNIHFSCTCKSQESTQTKDMENVS